MNYRSDHLSKAGGGGGGGGGEGGGCFYFFHSWRDPTIGG